MKIALKKLNQISNVAAHYDKRGSSHNGIIFLCVFSIILIFIIFVSQNLKEKVTQIKNTEEFIPIKIARKSAEVSKPKVKKEKIEKLASDSNKITRKTRVVRGRDYIESNFFVGDKHVGTLKEYADGRSDLKGEIPDGKVSFEDSYGNTTGQEYYRRGKKHGEVKEYYKDGKLRSEKEYKYGDLLYHKEYYADGSIRFDINMRNADDIKGSKEKGVGKLYYDTGKLKYEWQFTNDNPVRFQKSYNPDGALRYAAYFNQRGELVREEN